jgi:hypothetical protein
MILTLNLALTLNLYPSVACDASNQKVQVEMVQVVKN